MILELQKDTVKMAQHYYKQIKVFPVLDSYKYGRPG